MSKPQATETTRAFILPESMSEYQVRVEMAEHADGSLKRVTVEGFIFEGEELDLYCEVASEIAKAWRKGKRKPKS